mmetsp:Transcript_17863/g.38414  ORF Transcript_17863/g.38414 Transcript_17863/m.38414 type:complete len:97 (-) Transcript_17863:151-441(-)
MPVAPGLPTPLPAALPGSVDETLAALPLDDQIAHFTKVLGKLLRAEKQSLNADERKKSFRVLVTAWHPDKNRDNDRLATAVFQYLQEKRPWFHAGE